ncbi:hypothetical protein KKB99_08115, partial [bacterium]|nr:hypothetical protein [bacterium]MBU1025955.1 hypothetical protein [bacterium]
MTRLIQTLLILIVFLAGCSSDTSKLVTVSDSDQTPNLPSNSVENNSGQGFLGSWIMEFDTQNLSVIVSEDRTNAYHFNVKSMIPTPTVHINSYDPISEVIDVDVNIRNTSPFNGFDVRAIIYTDSIGHMLMNADNWTDLFDIAGGDTINPFKAYAKDEPMRMFAAVTQHTDNLQIRLPGGNGYVQFAIDASYPGNCGEPYQVSTFNQGTLLSSPGASTEVSVEVFDWQGNASAVLLHCAAVTGVDELLLFPVNPVIWGTTLINTTGAPPGNYEGLICAVS